MRLESNLKRIEDEYTGKIAKLKQLNKMENDKNSKLVKEMIELKKVTQIQKE